MPSDVLSATVATVGGVAVLGGFAAVFWIRTKPSRQWREKQRRIRHREDAEAERFGVTRRRLLRRLR